MQIVVTCLKVANGWNAVWYRPSTGEFYRETAGSKTATIEKLVSTLEAKLA